MLAISMHLQMNANPMTGSGTTQAFPEAALRQPPVSTEFHSEVYQTDPCPEIYRGGTN